MAGPFVTSMSTASKSTASKSTASKCLDWFDSALQEPKREKYVFLLNFGITILSSKQEAIKDNFVAELVAGIASGIRDDEIEEKEKDWETKKANLLANAVRTDIVLGTKRSRKKLGTTTIKEIENDIRGITACFTKKHGLLLGLLPGIETYYATQQGRLAVMWHVMKFDFVQKKKPQQELEAPVNHTLSEHGETVPKLSEKRQEQDGPAKGPGDSPKSIVLRNDLIPRANETTTTTSSPNTHTDDPSRQGAENITSSRSASRNASPRPPAKRPLEGADAQGIKRRRRLDEVELEPGALGAQHEIHARTGEQYSTTIGLHANETPVPWPSAEARVQRSENSAPLLSADSELPKFQSELIPHTKTIRYSLSTDGIVRLMTVLVGNRLKPYHCEEPFDYYDLTLVLHEFLSSRETTLHESLSLIQPLSMWVHTTKKDSMSDHRVKVSIAMYSGDMAKPSYLCAEIS
jgi:hypothetical protein